LKNLKKKTRTVVRLTLIHNMNMFDLKGYARLIEIAQPNFIEVKSYMWMGYSKKRLNPRDSPYHYEIKEFCNELVKEIPYKIADEQEISRVVLLKRKGERIKRFIKKV
jgi:tRNA wybutosine-synthesizing protein 1